MSVQDNEANASNVDYEKAQSVVEKFTAEQKALTFYFRVTDEDRLSLVRRLYEEGSEELYNALCMSDDDYVLALLQLTANGTNVIIFSVLEERYLKRNLAVFSVNRLIRMFGRLAYVKHLESSGDLLVGIQSVSIALA